MANLRFEYYMLRLLMKDGTIVLTDKCDTKTAMIDFNISDETEFLNSMADIIQPSIIHEASDDIESLCALPGHLSVVVNNTSSHIALDDITAIDLVFSWSKVPLNRLELNTTQRIFL